MKLGACPVRRHDPRHVDALDSRRHEAQCGGQADTSAPFGKNVL